MKILQIFGAVVAIHLLAFIFIFASPGCSSSPRSVPTPDATVPTVASQAASTQPVVFATTPPPEPASEPGRASPTRPGSPNAVALTPAKPAAEDVAPVTHYVVQQGDSLWIVAKKNHLTVSELAKANHLGANATLSPGRKLVIPGKPGPAPAKETPVAPAAAAAAPTTESKAPSTAAARSGGEAVKHTVQSGESLGTIARKYSVRVGDLAAANNITDPAKIRVGQQLVIPGGNGAAKSAPAKSAAPKSAAKPAAGADKPAADKAAEAAAAKDLAPHFDIKAPPPGQDLDAGLKENPATEVPTIKVDDTSKAQETPKK